MNQFLVFISTIVLASCATTPGYESALSSWAGAQEVELIRVWGPPARTLEANNKKFMVYESRRKFHIPGTGAVYTERGMSGGSPSMDIELICVTNFELESSRIVSWSWQGNDCKSKTSSPLRG